MGVPGGVWMCRTAVEIVPQNSLAYMGIIHKQAKPIPSKLFYCSISTERGVIEQYDR
jgi:hypothetical protein